MTVLHPSNITIEFNSATDKIFVCQSQMRDLQCYVEQNKIIDVLYM